MKMETMSAMKKKGMELVWQYGWFYQLLTISILYLMLILRI
jgi:hypothetical protein